MSDTSSIIQILFSVAGAEAVTGAMSNLQNSSANLGGELMRLGGVALSLNTAFDGLKGALGFGSDLTILASRIGSTVENVVVMSRAFEMAGLSADRMGVMVNRLQKAVSGVNEMGKSTKGAFSALGLDPTALQGMKFEDQLEKMAAGFQKIHDPAERAAVAMDLFGREGGQMMRLLTQQGLLGQAADDAGRLAARMGQDAEAFKAVEDRLSLMKLRMREMWVVAMEQLLPALEKVGSVIKGLNLGPLGAALGSGGAIALAAGMATGMASKLDTMLMGWATSPGTSAAATTFATNFILPFSNGLVTLFKTILPAVIIAAVAGAIIVAIAQVILDSQNRMSAIQGAGFSDIHKVASSLGGARNADEYAAAQQSGAALRDQRQKDLDLLKAKQQEIADFNKGLMATGNPNAMYGQQSMSSDDLTKMDALKNSIDGINRLLAVTPKDSILDANAVKAANAQYKDLVGNLEKLREQHQKDVLVGETHAKQLEMLNSQKAGLVAKDKSPDTGLTAEQAEAKHLSLAHEIAVVEKEIETTNKAITEDKKKQLDHATTIHAIEVESQILKAHAAGNRGDEQAAKEQLMRLQLTKELTEAGATDLSLVEQKVAAFHAEYVEATDALAQQKAKEALQAALNLKQEEANALQNDYTKTDDEKWPIRQKNLKEQLALFDQYIAKLKAERALEAPGSTHADALTKQIDEGEKGKLGVTKSAGQMGPDPHVFSQNWTKALTDLRTQWTTTAKTIATTIGSLIGGAVDSVSKNLTAAIMRTESWGQAFRNVGNEILTSVVGAIVKMAVEWVASQIMMALFGKAIAAATTESMTPVAAQLTAMWTAPATLATIASFGGAAAAAPFEVMGALGLTEMLTLPTAAEGGYFPGQDGRIAGAFHGNEFVFSAPAVRAIGPANLEAQHAAAVSGSAGGAGGKGQGSAKPQRIIHVLAGGLTDAKQLFRDPAFDSKMLDWVHRHKGDFLET
jgi:uncharacterized membrane protein